MAGRKKKDDSVEKEKAVVKEGNNNGSEIDSTDNIDSTYNVENNGDNHETGVITKGKKCNTGKASSKSSKSSKSKVVSSKGSKSEKKVKTKVSQDANIPKKTSTDSNRMTTIGKKTTDKKTIVNKKSVADKNLDINTSDVSTKVVSKPKKVSDPYKLNLSHARVVQTCYKVRNEDKNWVTEHGADYSITLFRKRIFKVILTEIMLSKGYKSAEARLKAEAILPGIDFKSYSALISTMYAYIYDPKFRSLLNYNIDRNIYKILNLIKFNNVDYKPKITLLDTNYSKVAEMKMVLSYLFDVLFEIRKQGILNSKQSVITRGTNTILKEIGVKEYKEHYYFFHRGSRVSIVPCRKMDITQYTDDGNIFSCIDTVSQSNYSIVIDLLVLKKISKEAFADLIELVDLHMIDYLTSNKINTPLSLYEMALSIVVSQFGKDCMFDKEVNLYFGSEYTNLDWWYRNIV